MKSVINLNKDDFQSKTILDIHGIAPSICAGEGGNKLKVVYPMVLKMGCKGETYDEHGETPPLDSSDSKHPVVICYEGQSCASNTTTAYTIQASRVDDHHISVICHKSAGFVGRQGSKSGGLGLKWKKPQR